MEILGWIATVLVVVSTLFKDILTLRIVNSISCILWLIYGISLHTYPLITVNSLILLIQIYWIIRLLRTKEEKKVI